MQLETRTIANVHIISLLGPRLDALSRIDIASMVRDAAAERKRTIVIDLSRVEFVDSTGLGTLVAALKQAGESRLLVAGVHEPVATLFRLTRMDKVFTVLASVDEAVAESRSRNG